MKAHDSLLVKDNGWDKCTRAVPGKHRPKEGPSKWFKIERALGRFHGRDEEVERGKR
jgi:hypothetical protein